MGKLVLVNKNDEVIGFENKEKCHQGKGILHRAFTIFVFNGKDEILIQKRSKFKKLWPLCWETSCSSHPRKDETFKEAAEKRMKEELGFTLPLKLVDKFQYQVSYRERWFNESSGKFCYKNIGSENELCAILVGRYNGKEIKPNPKEATDWKWIGIEKLKKEIAKNPPKYVSWLKIGLKKISSYENKFKILF